MDVAYYEFIGELLSGLSEFFEDEKVVLGENSLD